MAKRTNEQGLSELREARPWTRDEGRRVFDAWAGSGETVTEFARRTGLDRQKIYGLRRRREIGPEEFLAKRKGYVCADAATCTRADTS